MNFYKSKIFRNFLSALILFILTLTVFYISFFSAFEKFFEANSGFKYEFTFYYILFSASLCFIFSAWAFQVFRDIFIPLGFVTKKLQSLRNPKETEQKVDYISEIPDFWNEVEEEIFQVEKFLGKRQKQADRIRRAIEQILEVFPEPSIIVSGDGLIRYKNKEFDKKFVPSETNPQFFSDIFREPQVLSLLQEKTDEFGTVRKEIQLSTQKSKQKVYIVFKTPFAIRNEDGERDQMLIFHDITQVRKTDKMKTDFVSNVSHELRTPLTSIKGYIQTLKEDIGAKRFEHVDKFFEIIESHVERLSLLINDLLELSYLESDEITLEKKKVSPRDITQKIIRQFSLDLEKGNYKVHENYDLQEIEVEERLLEQVIINLLQNSLRYTPPGTDITIEWKNDGTSNALFFKDNGPGISSEHLNRIFERFYRIDPHRSRTRGGTGLGLSIVKHIMQRHGGKVVVNSKLGHGLEFRCYF